MWPPRTQAQLQQHVAGNESRLMTRRDPMEYPWGVTLTQPYSKLNKILLPLTLTSRVQSHRCLEICIHSLQNGALE